MVHLVLFCAFVLSFAKHRIKFRQGKYTSKVFWGFVILFIFAALRYDYGNDFTPYRIIFENAHRGYNSAAVEPLYYEINKLFPSYQLLLAFLSFLYLLVVYKMIKRNVEENQAWLAMFIFVFNPYLFLLSLSTLRQTLVLCFFLIALSVKKESNIFKAIIYLAIIGVAVFIHQTAILLLPIYFVYNAPKSAKLDKIEMIMFATIPIVLLLMPQVLNQMIDQVLNLFSNNLNYLYYLKSNNQNSIRSTILTSVFYIYFWYNLRRVDGESYRLSKLYLIGLLFGILSYKYSMFGRFQMYFDIFGVVAIPNMLNRMKGLCVNILDRYINVYVFPILMIVIFILRYYSFFHTEAWMYFFEYHTFLFR